MKRTHHRRNLLDYCHLPIADDDNIMALNNDEADVSD